MPKEKEWKCCICGREIKPGQQYFIDPLIGDVPEYRFCSHNCVRLAFEDEFDIIEIIDEKPRMAKV